MSSSKFCSKLPNGWLPLGRRLLTGCSLLRVVCIAMAPDKPVPSNPRAAKLGAAPGKKAGKRLRYPVLATKESKKLRDRCGKVGARLLLGRKPWWPGGLESGSILLFNIETAGPCISGLSIRARVLRKERCCELMLPKPVVIGDIEAIDGGQEDKRLVGEEETGDGV